jgi:hypothetical protein
MTWPKHEMELVTWKDYIWVSSAPTILFTFPSDGVLLDDEGRIVGNTAIGYIGITFYSGR